MNTFVTEATDHGDIPIDVYQKLSNNRILFICSELTDVLATDICATLLLRDLENAEEKITLFINSEGGDIRNAFMIYDMMQVISSPIETICIGSAFNEIAIILAGGTPGMRFATKNSMICVGQLDHSYLHYSDLIDAKILLDLSAKDNKRMLDILAKNTGKPIKTITSDLERRVFMNASQACKYGLIDKVITIGKGK